jgi:cell wall-associated NlpC family hydrolase
VSLLALLVVSQYHGGTSVIRTTLSGSKAAAPAPTLATTTTAISAVAAPAVAAMGTLRAPDALVTLPTSVNATELHAVEALKGVTAVDVVDMGTVQLEGAPAVTVGVDPGAFRNFTPSVSAGADRLWQYISSGSLASSFEMSRDRQLQLGVEVPVVAAGSGAVTQHWLGAFMSIGLPGVDMVVSNQLSAQLGLTAGAGLVVSAPTTNPFSLQTEIQAVARGASVTLMRPGLALGSNPGTAGKGVLTAAQLSTALTSALSRVGLPYVWGATGPNGFDCSGLVGWSFAAAGVYLPRTAAGQALAGPAVPLNQIEPGDLLFWAFDPSDPTFIDHVAIYLGHGEMVQAPETGELVDVVPIYTHDLVGAVRVDPAIASRLGSPWHSSSTSSTVKGQATRR